MPSAAADRENAALMAIRRESWLYVSNKPGKVPPADSPSRPYLAQLWRTGHDAATRRPNARTFSHAGWKFGIVYLDQRLYVIDWQTRRILVRPPTSMEALGAVLGSQSACKT